MYRLALLLIFATPLAASAQLTTTREQEIALAETAAPAAVARDASLYVFGKAGYERVREGKNGFTCLVNRDSFLEGYEVLKPTCWDAEGSGTIVPQILFIGKRKAEGANAETVRAEVSAKTAAGEFRYPVGHGLGRRHQGWGDRRAAAPLHGVVFRILRDAGRPGQPRARHRASHDRFRPTSARRRQHQE